MASVYVWFFFDGWNASVVHRKELICCGHSDAIVTHLPLADHMHDLDAEQDDSRAPKIIESQHRFDDAFDGAVVLLDDVVQILI